jgi:adenine-specific DNA methylase
LEVSRNLVKAAHPEETPLVVDPFAGGGSIPLEALRLGCEAFASDLNPVACLILKVMLEDIPRYGPKLAEELRRVGKEIKEAVEKELGGFYPNDPSGDKPIAYLWARTVRCEAPNCGAEIPLVRSFWLCKKANRKRALRAKVIRPKDGPPKVEFEIFEPKNDSEVPAGTVNRAKPTCLCCGMVLSPERVRSQLVAQRGGADVIFNELGNHIGGARLLAVVTLKSDEQGRHYRLPNGEDYKVVWKAKKRLEKIINEPLINGLRPIPDEPVDPWHHDVNRMPMYGMTSWGDLFTTRQKLVLLTLIKNVRKSSDNQIKDVLGLLMDRGADFWVSLARWKADAECPVQALARQALPIVWDFTEANPFSNSTGSLSNQVDRMVYAIQSSAFQTKSPGQVQRGDARNLPIPDESINIWFTDPPYYDAIDYAHCSDFFFVWLKRALPDNPFLKNPNNPLNLLTPKKNEIVVDSTTTKGHGIRTPAFYEQGMAEAFAEGRRVLKEEGVGCVVFAHKTTEGWESLLSGMIKGGWIITGSWPIATEMGSRLRAQDSAALATSVHLVCRPRPEDTPVGDWGEVLRELPKRVGDWMERLQSEGIRGADLVFACIGPALEIYSRYSKVVDAEEREIPLGGDPEASEPYRKGFLAYVWEVVGRTALEQVLGTPEARARNSTAGALEEDARLTALFLWTLQSTNGESPSPQPTPAKGRGSEGEGDEEEDEEEETPKKKKQGYTLIFDVVRRFAQPLGIHLPEWEGRIIETEKGVVRLLSVKERTKQLFGEESISVAGIRIEEQARRNPQMKFDFAVRLEAGVVPKIKGRRSKSPQPPFSKGGLGGFC